MSRYVQTFCCTFFGHPKKCQVQFWIPSQSAVQLFKCIFFEVCTIQSMQKLYENERKTFLGFCDVSCFGLPSFAVPNFCMASHQSYQPKSDRIWHPYRYPFPNPRDSCVKRYLGLVTARKLSALKPKCLWCWLVNHSKPLRQGCRFGLESKPNPGNQYLFLYVSCFSEDVK